MRTLFLAAVLAGCAAASPVVAVAPASPQIPLDRICVETAADPLPPEIARFAVGNFALACAEGDPQSFALGQHAA